MCNFQGANKKLEKRKRKSMKANKGNIYWMEPKVYLRIPLVTINNHSKTQHDDIDLAIEGTIGSGNLR